MLASKVAPRYPVAAVARPRSPLRNRVEYLAYRVAAGAVRALGPRSASRLGAALGLVFHLASSRRRRIADANLALAYPELGTSERRALGREVARHFGRAALETLWLQRIPVGDLERATHVEGEEHLRAALERGRGVILLSAHIGVWEVAALITGRRLPEGVMLVHRPLDNPLLEAELARLRARFGNRLVGKHRIQGELKRELAGGGVIGILLDQRPPEKLAVEVPFFGQPTPTNSALALLARATTAPIVPVWGLWDAPGRYTVRFEEPLLVGRLDEQERTTAAITARCTARIEGVIRERPEQWLWFHDRWRGLQGAGE